MTAVRRRLAGLVCMCLLWQAGAYATAATVAGFAAGDLEERPACCRLHGPDHVCPMDQARAARHASKAPCLVDVCCSPNQARLTIFGTIGIPTTSSWSLDAGSRTARPRWSPGRPAEHEPVPTVPPPRR